MRIMTLKTFFAVSLVSLAVVVAPQMGLTAAAQNNDNQSKSNSAKSDSNQQQNTSSSESTSAPNDSQSGQNANQSSSSKKDSSNPPATSSSQQNSTSTNNNQQDRDRNNNRGQNAGQSNANNNAKSGTQKSGASTDDGQPEKRSLLKDQNRDSQTNRDSSDGSSRTDARSDSRDGRDSRDNRDDSRHARNRDFRSDFKFGKATARGLVIASIVHDSIFYRSGLRDGDVIVSYNGRPLRSQDDFVRFVVYQPGQRVPLVVLRNGREETIYVVYQDDTAQIRGSGSANFGAEFDPQANDIAVIVHVDDGSPADRAGLKRNDVVLAINGERVSSGRDAMEIIRTLKPGDRVDVEYSRNARAEVVLSGSRQGDNSVSDTRYYRGDDRGTSVATGVGTDETRRDGAARDRNSQDRRDERREGRGILPRLRN